MLVSGEVLGAEGELDGAARGEVDWAGADWALALLALVAVPGGKHAGAEDQYLYPL